MYRAGPWLLVEDNGDCGGANVTFTGSIAANSRHTAAGSTDQTT
jgi:hypothetical protein